MKTVFEYIKSDTKVLFESIEDKECFYSNGVLYMKIMQQDLDFYKINSTDINKGINCVSILNGGLTLFEADESVYKAIKEYKMIR